MVPISICTSEDAKCCKLKVLLDRPETTITVSGVGPDQWVKVSRTKSRREAGSDAADDAAHRLVRQSTATFPVAQSHKNDRPSVSVDVKRPLSVK